MTSSDYWGKRGGSSFRSLSRCGGGLTSFGPFVLDSRGRELDGTWLVLFFRLLLFGVGVWSIGQASIGQTSHKLYVEVYEGAFPD